MIALSYKIKHFLYKKLEEPILNILNKGADSYRLALALTIGILIGLFPMIGVTTFMGLIIAIVFRLNLVAIQIANYIVYPIQLLLLVPYLKAGAWLLQVKGVPLTIFVKQFIFSDLFSGFSILIKSFLGALIIWFILSFILGFIIFKLMKIIIERISKPH